MSFALPFNAALVVAGLAGFALAFVDDLLHCFELFFLFELLGSNVVEYTCRWTEIAKSRWFMAFTSRDNNFL
jgi:hypothetical protein